MNMDTVSIVGMAYLTGQLVNNGILLRAHSSKRLQCTDFGSGIYPISAFDSLN